MRRFLKNINFNKHFLSIFLDVKICLHGKLMQRKIHMLVRI